MWVRKESGGTTMTYRRVDYEWPDAGSVTEVPDEFGAILLAIRGGGYSEVPAPKPAEFSEVDPAAQVTEDGCPQDPGGGGATDPGGDGGGPEGDPGSADGDPSAGDDAKPETAKPARSSRAKGKDAPEA